MLSKPSPTSSCGKSSAGVRLDPEQISNCIVVFSAVQTMQRRSTGVMNLCAVEVVKFIVKEFGDFLADGRLVG